MERHQIRRLKIVHMSKLAKDSQRQTQLNPYQNPKVIFSLSFFFFAEMEVVSINTITNHPPKFRHQY